LKPFAYSHGRKFRPLFSTKEFFLEDVMKKLIGCLMVAAFCGAASLVWADPMGQANKGNPQFMPPNLKPKVISGHTGKGMPSPKTKSLKEGKITRNSRLNEEEGIYYNFNHTDSSHTLVTGKAGKDATLNAGGKATSKMAGHDVVKNPLMTKTDEKNGIYYDFHHTDSSHPLVTGKAGKDATLNAGGKVNPKMNAPQDGKNTQTTVKKVGNEVLVPFQDGDPDKPIVTGQTYNGAATTGGK
jgi:hypothetical protein